MKALTQGNPSVTLRVGLVGNRLLDMPIGVLTFRLHLPGCSSLKEKRNRIKPVISRLSHEFNVATAELDFQDVWQDSMIGCVTISNDAAQNQRLLQQILAFIQRNWPDLDIVTYSIEQI